MVLISKFGGQIATPVYGHHLLSNLLYAMLTEVEVVVWNVDLDWSYGMKCWPWSKSWYNYRLQSKSCMQCSRSLSIECQSRSKSRYTKPIAIKVFVSNVNHGRSQDMQCRLWLKSRNEMLIVVEGLVCNFYHCWSWDIECRPWSKSWKQCQPQLKSKYIMSTTVEVG